MNVDVEVIENVTTVVVTTPGPQGPQGAVVFDGGRPDTDFTVGVTVDCGGVN